MFTGFMVNAWEAGTIVAVVAGVVGFFVVLRGFSFPAHAIPNGAFAGAAGANLLGLDPLVGLGVFSLAAAVGIAGLSRRGRNDAVTALALVAMLALGAAFLSLSTEYEAQIFSLLFGEVLGVSRSELVPVIVMAAGCLLVVAAFFRRFVLCALAPDVAAARGLRPERVDLVLLVVIAAATTITVPVVGALLIFSLMIGPPAAARHFTDRVAVAVGLAVGLALVTLWSSLALAYATNWPVGFFVATIAAGWFVVGRVVGAARRRARPARLASH